MKKKPIIIVVIALSLIAIVAALVQRFGVGGK